MTDARHVFAQHGLRRTRQREVIYAALAATREHPTADELFAQVTGGEPGMSLATVYNTLEALTAAGLCRRLPPASGSGSCRYDAVTDDHAHVTLPDGRALDVPLDLSRALLRGVCSEALAALEARMGVRVLGVTLTVTAEPAAEPAGELAGEPEEPVPAPGYAPGACE